MRMKETNNVERNTYLVNDAKYHHNTSNGFIPVSTFGTQVIEN